MFDSTRRNFLRQTTLGLAATGVSGLVLCSHARPTQEVNRDGSNAVEERNVNGQKFQTAVFDIVLERAAK